jgi:hypothetical protein
MSSGVVERIRTQSAINPRLLRAIDQLLIAGIKLGPRKKHEAINKILQVVPEWKRGDCWRRIRQLRRTAARVTPRVIQNSEQTENDGSSHRPRSRPWLSDDDEKLLDLAGYEPVTKIAHRLGRSVRAVRFRLGALGMSARVRDGWSQRGLRKLLRVSRARLRSLVASGMLRVRDPRIRGSSLAAWYEKKGPATDTSTTQRPKAAMGEQEACSWKRAATLLAITLEDVQNLISAGRLKLVDTFVTDRSLEDFCRNHGNEINMALIDPSTRKWLISEYGVSEIASGTTVPRAQKHALVIRECRCGRKIAGNVYFRHVRHCRPAEQRIPDTSSHVAANGGR